MQEKKTERAPGSYEDFVAYLGTVRTEEELFSPVSYTHLDVYKRQM